LIAALSPIICAECKRKRDGKTTNDRHHVAGAANDRTTIEIPVNDHRADLSVSQGDWPKQTLENAAGSPLLAKAGSIRGQVDTTRYLDEKLLLPGAEMLEALDEYLKNKLGPEWWKGTELERFRGTKG
jgi:hypothetical protein